VHIEPADGPDRVRVRIDDGDTVVIDASVVGSPNASTTWSLRDVVTGVVSTAAVTLGSSGEGDAVVAGHTVPVALANRRRRARAMLGAGNGAQRIVAPMPGKVVKVLVALGDAVDARQGLVVVEAMKMENELTAARAGTVTELAVAEGASVEAGRLLIVVS
jgi:biotin carboxyl carrier protein